MSVPTLDGATERLADALEKFAKELRENQRPLPPEFRKVLEDNYWELLTDEPQMCPACRDGGVCGCILFTPKIT